MPERAGLFGVWREGVSASLRSYRLIGRLTVDWIGTVAPALGGLGARRPAPDRAAPSSAGDVSGPAIVVEAEAGKRGQGVFLVENRSARSVSAPVILSPLVDRQGRQVHASVRFRPGVITLDPGEQVLVQVTAAVDETLEPRVGYRGEISVPELSGTRIPIVVRRRSASPAGSAPRATGPSKRGRPNA